MHAANVRHSREGGNPEVLFKRQLGFVFAEARNITRLDSRFHWNDGAGD